MCTSIPIFTKCFVKEVEPLNADFIFDVCLHVCLYSDAQRLMCHRTII